MGEMNKNMIIWFAVSAVLMLALPWLAVTFVKGDAGMAVCFLLFFAVNPIYCVIAGTFAERICGNYGAFRLYRLHCFWSVRGYFLIWGKQHLSCMQRSIWFWG